MRLPDHELTVLVDRAAEGATEAHVMFGGPRWADMTLARQNEVRELALPYIVAGTRALADLGYRKPRTITTIGELDALPEGSVVLDPIGLSLHRNIDGWMASNGTRGLSSPVAALDALPATVLHEPEVQS